MGRKRTKKRSKSRLRRLIGITLLSTLGFLVLKSIFSSSDMVQLPTKELNKTITNNLSQIPEMDGMDKKILQFIKRWDINGASIAIVRNDSLVYAKGYGWADKEKGVQMEPCHIMRVA